MKGAERWEAETQLCLTPLKSVVDQDIQVAKGEGEGGRSIRPEIRGMPGLKQKKTFLAPSGFRARLHGEFHPGLKFQPG